MNENTHTPPPVPPSQPDEQPTTVLGAQPAAESAPQPDPTAAPAATSAPTGPTPVGTSPGAAYPPPTGTYPPPAPGYPQQGAYPPSGYPQPGAYPPPASAQVGGYPPGYPPPAGRRLVRSRSDRMLGGVCGGLARYWNTDPVLLRILTVVLTLATGGAFLVGYVIAWIAIPDEPAGPYSPVGPGPGQVGYAAGGNPPYADQPGLAPAPRERSYLGWLIASAALLVAGVLGVIGLLVPASPQFWGIIGGVAVTILGLGLLIGARYGRARWLVLLAVPLAFLTFATVAAGNWITDNPNWDRWSAGTGDRIVVGDRTWVVGPEDVSSSPLDFRLSAGEAVLDLTDLTALGGAESARMGQRVAIDAGVGLGQLTVLIPADMTLDLDASVDVGEIAVPGRDRLSGTNLALETLVEPLAAGQPAYIVTLDAAIGAGNLEVRREAA